MKASLVAPVGQASSDFVSLNRLFTPTLWTATIAQIIIASARSVDSLIKAVVLDRPAQQPNTNGRLLIFPTSADVLSALPQGAPDFVMTGTKVDGGSSLQWGVGDITPTAVDTAVEGALAELDFPAEVGENEPLTLAVAGIVAPSYGAFSPRSGLEKVIDLVEKMRTNLVVPCLQVIQQQDAVVVEFRAVPFDEYNATRDALGIMNGKIAEFEMKMPEAVVANTPAARYALE